MDVSQAFITDAFSSSNGLEKRHQDDPPACNRAEDAVPAATLSGCFDCNICLDLVVDPVVTLCGHLYCWPCIYKWMQAESDAHQRCPVCKAFLSQDTVVPLYGRGGDSTKAGSDVPHRPILHLPRDRTPATPLQQQQQPPPPPQVRHRRHFRSDASVSAHQVFDRSSPLFRSTGGGVLGGLAIAVLPWVCRGGGGSGARAYYGNTSYFLTLSGNSPRLRRQQMEVESSLHQIWIFLCFCAVLCLLLF